MEILLALIGFATGLALFRLLSNAEQRGSYREACEDRLVDWCVSPRTRG